MSKSNEVTSPSSTIISSASTPQKLWSRLEDRWNEVQVGRQGSYSVERLESFDRYCKTASQTRVFLVCVCTPLPALSAAVLLECMPLRPPSDGWAANWVLWIRLFLTTFIMTFAGVSQLVTLVPDLNPTLLKRLLVTGCAAFGYAGTCLCGAKLIGFPIPMMWYLGGFIMGLYVPLMMVLVFGRKQFASTSPYRRNIRRFLNYFGASMTLMNVFPLYKVLYEFMPSAYRVLVVIVLPLWRFAAKRFVVQSTREWEDFMPETVAMIVDLFSALFISVCMSTTGSIYLSVVFIIADIGQLVLEVREIRTNAHVVSKMFRGQHAPSDRFYKRLADVCQTSGLVALILEVTRDPTTFRVTSLEGARLRACFPHAISSEQAELLKVLEASHLYDCDSASTIHAAQSLHKQRRRSWLPSRLVQNAMITSINAVKPLPTKLSNERGNGPFTEVQVFHADLKHAAASGEKAKRLVLQGLQLLFHCEYVILVEYVECVVPLIFVTYKAVLEHLPNVVYYPGGAGHFDPVNVLVFALLEIGSLLFVYKSLQRQFGFSPLYQLAFVLETQVYLVQAQLVVMGMFLLTYELEHYGIDFTFQFEWLHEPCSSAKIL